MQSRTRRAVIATVALATLAAVAFDIYLSLDPNKYFFYSPEDRQEWVYSTTSVAFVCLTMIAEAALALAAFVLRRPRALWLRCLFALILLAPWALFSTMFVIHMPGYTLFHHLWVWLVTLSLAVVAICSAARRLYLRWRGGPPNNSFKPNLLRKSA